jgi:hypothetical protein
MLYTFKQNEQMKVGDITWRQRAPIPSRHFNHHLQRRHQSASGQVKLMRRSKLQAPSRALHLVHYNMIIGSVPINHCRRRPLDSYQIPSDAAVL